jgi:hypothetical protein
VHFLKLKKAGLIFTKVPNKGANKKCDLSSLRYQAPACHYQLNKNLVILIKISIQMKIALIIVILLFILYFLKGSQTGYVKKNGDWTWVTIDESHGKRLQWIEGIDQNTFTVLKNKSFALDQNQVYFKGRKINHASPDGFLPLTDDEYGYAKDNNHAFFNDEVIIHADPATFEVIEFPYSKDKNDVYCGTLPMKLSREDVRSFRVTNDDKLMARMISTATLSHFLEFHPEYIWLKEQGIEIKNVISGDTGTGETNNKKFNGFKEVK